MDPAIERRLKRLDFEDRFAAKLKTVLTEVFGGVGEVRVLGEGETWEQSREKAVQRRWRDHQASQPQPKRRWGR